MNSALLYLGAWLALGLGQTALLPPPAAGDPAFSDHMVRYGVHWSTFLEPLFGVRWTAAPPGREAGFAVLWALAAGLIALRWSPGHALGLLLVSVAWEVNRDIVPALGITASTTEIWLAAVGLAWILRRGWRTGLPFSRRIAAMAAWLLLASFFSPGGWENVVGLARWTELLLVFWIAASLPANIWQTLRRWILAGGAVVALVALIQWREPGGLVTGPFPHHVQLGSYLAFPLFATLAGGRLRREWPLAVLFCLGWIASGSVGAILAAAAVSAGWFVWKTRRKWRVIAASFLLFLFFGAGMLSPEIRRKIGLRAEAWRVGLKIAAAHPIFGLGPNRYGEFIRSQELSLPAGLSYDILSSVHSLPIQLMVEGGVPLLLLAGWLLAGCLGRWRERKWGGEWGERKGNGWTAGFVLFYLLHGLADFLLFEHSLGLPLAACLGFLAKPEESGIISPGRKTAAEGRPK